MATPNIAQIPATNDVPWYNFKVTLSGTLYTLRFRFNTRMNRWILDLADAQNNDILNSLPMLINRNMNGRFVTPDLPPGFLFCTDDTNQGTQPTRYSFGKDHSLFYFDPTGSA